MLSKLNYVFRVCHLHLPGIFYLEPKTLPFAVLTRRMAFLIGIPTGFLGCLIFEKQQSPLTKAYKIERASRRFGLLVRLPILQLMKKSSEMNFLSQ